MNAVEELLRHYRRQRRWTRTLIEALPEEHFGWAPDESSFGCGDLVRHLIQAEIFWRRLLEAAVRGEHYDPFGMAGDAAERMREFRQPNLRASRSSRLGSSFGECLAAWEEVEAATEVFLGSLTTEQLASVEARHPLTDLEGTLRELLMVMFEHEAYHRGQLAAYGKVLGLELPATQWT